MKGWRFWSIYSEGMVSVVRVFMLRVYVKMLSLSYASRVRKLWEMCLLAGVLAVETVICKNKTTEITSHIIAKKNAPRSWTVVDSHSAIVKT